MRSRLVVPQRYFRRFKIVSASTILLIMVVVGVYVTLWQVFGLSRAGWQIDFHLDRNPIHGCHHWVRVTADDPPDWLNPDGTRQDIRLDWERKLGVGLHDHVAVVEAIGKLQRQDVGQLLDLRL